MRQQFTLFILLLAVWTASAQEPIPGQYIVILKESVARPVISQQKKNSNREAKERGNQPARDKILAKVRDVRTKSKIKENAVLQEYSDVLSGFAAKLSAQEKKALESDPDVAGVYPDFAENLPSLKAEPNPDKVIANLQHVSCAVSMVGGPAAGGGKATWIWILDTGIDLDHPDLNVQTSSTFAKSFVTGQSVDDGNGHGTHMAGVAAAKNNNFGAVGVSAGARVVPVKVINNSGSGSWSAILAGLNHIAQYDIPGDVVNLSLGTYGVSNCENANPALRDAIRNLGAAGTYVVMSAGSNGGNAALSNPGCINGTRIYTVGAIDCNKNCASFSNWGSPVDWAAPGVNIYSTYKNGGYINFSGTAKASSIVAGIIHARGGPPVSAGTVTCAGKPYKIAHL